jgi:hypothetical protein
METSGDKNESKRIPFCVVQEKKKEEHNLLRGWDKNCPTKRSCRNEIFTARKLN